jgi:S-formylglutathione hydrolase FrmB
MVSESGAQCHGRRAVWRAAWSRGFLACVSALLAVCCAAPALAQSKTEAPPVVPDAVQVRIEKIKVHSQEIAGNLLGTSAERDVIVILPPSYDKQLKRRYPVLYALHGFGNSAQGWLGQLHAPDTVQAAYAKGTPEMILVFPSSENAYGGSFYSNSPATGNFENFIADELIAYVDGHYRSIASPKSRGLVGHSMGGYGAARIGMRRAEQFGALYLMSPCCLSPLGAQGMTEKEVAGVAAMTGPNDAVGAAFRYQGPLATGAAWAPNPGKPPMFVDLAVDEKGQLRPDIMAKRAANAPLAFVDQYIWKLRQYRAIGLDVGDQDILVADTTKMRDVLASYGIKSQFEIYSGTHTSRVAFRFQDHVLPFFGAVLDRNNGNATSDR